LSERTSEKICKWILIGLACLWVIGVFIAMPDIVRNILRELEETLPNILRVGMVIGVLVVIANKYGKKGEDDKK